MNKKFFIRNFLIAILLGPFAYVRAQDSQEIADTLQIGYPETDSIPGTLLKVEKRTSTAAISTVKGSELERIPTMNITNTLYGRLAGLTVTQASGEPGNDRAQLLIRGNGTYGVGGYNNIKIFVDGFEVNANYFDYLSPAEIESISVLKDAAALAPFGMRGSNGIIWVITKRGREGKSRMKVNFKSGIQTAININKPLDAYQYARYYNEAISNDNGMLWSPYYNEDEIEGYRNGQGTNVDWYDQTISQTGTYYSGDVVFDGGDENAKYTVIFDYANKEGLYNATNTDTTSNNRFYRMGLRANLDFKLFSIFDAKVDIGGRLQKQKRPNYQTSDLFEDLSRYPSNIYPVYDNEDLRYFSGTNLFPNNPVASSIGLGWFSSQGRILQGNFSLRENLDFILDGLYAEEAFSFNSYALSTYSKTRNYGRYQDGELTTTDQPSSIVASGYGSAGMEDWKQAKVTIGYKNSFDKSDINAAIGFHSSDYKADGLFGYKYHYLNLNGKFKYDYDNRYILAAAFSYFGNDAYAPKNRWGFYPAVSAAWLISNENFLSGDNISLLKLRASVGKLGGADSDATGALGNFSSNGRYLYQQYYNGSSTGSFYTGNSTPTWQNTLAPLFIPNRDVFAETSLKYNVGLDMDIWNKLEASIDIFLDKRSDILTVDNSIPNYYGNNYYYSNIGKMTNKGLEATAVYKDKIGEFTYALNGMLSYSKNTIDYMAELAPAYPYNAQTGRSFGTPIGLKAEGLYQLNDFNADGSLKANIPQPAFGLVQPGDVRYMDLDDDGFIDQTDFTAIGKSPFPEMVYSFGGNLGFKGLELNVLFQGVHGASFNLLNNWSETVAFVNNGNIHEIAEGAWAYYPEQGIDTRATATYPRLTTRENNNNYQNSSYWIKSADYLRLRNIELAYSFNSQNLLDKLNLSQLSIYVSATNLVTWSSLLKNYNIDPETTSGYPGLKSIVSGITVSF